MAIEIWVEAELWNLSDEKAVEAGSKLPVQARVKVDNGSWRTLLPQPLVEQLNLARRARPMRVTYADGRTAERDVALGLRLRIQDRDITTDALVEPERTTVLLGAGDLEALGFNIDMQNGHLKPYPGTEAGQCAVIE